MKQDSKSPSSPSRAGKNVADKEAEARLAGPGQSVVGRVKDGHGIKGELYITIFSGEASWSKGLAQLRIIKPTDGTPLILTVKSLRMHKGGLIVKTEELKDRNAAEALKGYLLTIPEEMMVSRKGEAIFLKEIEGFAIFVKGHGEVGHIEGFATNGVQDLLVVRTAKGAFDIPFVKAFVERMDFPNKALHLDLPVGLLGEEIDAGERETDAGAHDHDHEHDDDVADDR